MRYALLIYTPEPSAPPSEQEIGAVMTAWANYDREVKERGVFLGGEALEQTRTATTVRVKDGQKQVTDGPFAETKEALGGFYLLECRDLDEAIEWAEKMPGAQRGAIEIRPIWEVPREYDAQQAQGAAARS
jgi:hypothetical protein